VNGQAVFVRRSAVALGVAALVGGHVGSAHAATMCRAGGVEMIVGGPSAAECAAPQVAATGITVTARSPASGALRVEPAVQRERDQERRRILEEEFQHEQALLSSLLKQGPAADPAGIVRTQQNLAALRQELARSTP
jgi:hypothetical protein